MNIIKIVSLCFLAFSLLTFLKCSDSSDDLESRMVVLKISSPNKDAQYIEGQDVTVNLDIKENNPEAQLKIILNGVDFFFKKGVATTESITIPADKIKLGYNDIEIHLDGFEGEKHTEKRRIIVFANTTPEIYIPEIQVRFPHNPKHYTQGYEFFNGSLYEGTGQLSQSMLAEINLKSGESIRKIENESNIFGEGITILNNEVFQLTWQNKVCYVYNLEDFSKTRQYTYDGEGWGLANDGKVIYMSNGSSTIYVRDPKTFDVIRTFDVFSNRQEYRALNELEFVDGFLYANVYTQNYIVKIDPKDGRVVGIIDCEDLVTEGQGSGEVLNGIAYNHKNQRFYITGKYWEKVFEVILKTKSPV